MSRYGGCDETLLESSETNPIVGGCRRRGRRNIEKNKKRREKKDQSQLEGVSISNSKPVPGCSLCG